MSEIGKIIADLKTVKRVPNMFVNPVTPEMLSCYLTGLQRGALLSQNTLSFDDFVDGHRFAMNKNGLNVTAAHPYHQLREKGMSEEDIIQVMLDIEIEMWRVLEKWENEK